MSTDTIRIDRLTTAQVCDLRAALDAAGIAGLVDLRNTFATWAAADTPTVRTAVVNEKHERRAVHRMPTVALSSLLRKIDAAAQGRTA